MSWLENLGLILVLLVFSMAFFSVTRVDRVITYWFWAWAAQLAAAVLLGTHPDASIAHATGRGLALLAPTLQLCGALVYVGWPVARWIVPLGVALVGARVLLHTLGPADLERVLATCVEVGAYTCALVLVAQGGGSTNWTGRCLILGYAGLLSVEIYDLVVELHSQTDHVAWTLWVVVGVFMGATQIQVAFRRARTTNDRNDQLAARTAMDRFDALVRHSKDIVAEVGSDGRLSYVSPNVERHLGYHPDELIGRSMRGLLTPARADWQSRNESRTAVDLGALVAAGPYDTLYQALTKGGERRWLEIQASHYFTPNAEIRAVAIIRDVTERETLHRQHLESQNLESLGVLAGGIAHDFNNLLTAIIGNIGIARESIPAGSAADAPLAQIDKAASRAAQLTSKLLAYAGNVPATPTTVDVVQVANEMQHMLDTAISKKAHLSWKRPQEPMLADADPTLLTQVIMNLMTNASEALDGLPGNIELVVVRAAHSACCFPKPKTPRHCRRAKARVCPPGAGMGLPWWWMTKKSSATCCNACCKRSVSTS